MKPEATAIGDPQNGCWKITAILRRTLLAAIGGFAVRNGLVG